MAERDIPTEPIRRRDSDPGVVVKIGASRWTIPTLTIVTATLAALGTAYRVVANDRDALISRVGALEERGAAMRAELNTSLALQQEIRAGIARLDARVAEIQVTLMGRPR